MNEVVIDDSQREMCAVLVMRTMLTDYCNDTGVSFNDVFFRFVTSPAYKMLFDYSTGLWMEGPDYLRNIFEDTMKTNTSLKQPESYLISEEEMLRRLGITEADLAFCRGKIGSLLQLRHVLPNIQCPLRSRTGC